MIQRQKKQKRKHLSGYQPPSLSAWNVGSPSGDSREDDQKEHSHSVCSELDCGDSGVKISFVFCLYHNKLTGLVILILTSSHHIRNYFPFIFNFFK